MHFWTSEDPMEILIKFVCFVISLWRHILLVTLKSWSEGEQSSGVGTCMIGKSATRKPISACSVLFTCFLAMSMAPKAIPFQHAELNNKKYGSMTSCAANGNSPFGKKNAYIRTMDFVDYCLRTVQLGFSIASHSPNDPISLSAVSTPSHTTGLDWLPRMPNADQSSTLDRTSSCQK